MPINEGRTRRRAIGSRYAARRRASIQALSRRLPQCIGTGWRLHGDRMPRVWRRLPCAASGAARLKTRLGTMDCRCARTVQRCDDSTESRERRTGCSNTVNFPSPKSVSRTTVCWFRRKAWMKPTFQSAPSRTEVTTRQRWLRITLHASLIVAALTERLPLFVPMFQPQVHGTWFPSRSRSNR